jgi:hypothetical protein
VNPFISTAGEVHYKHLAFEGFLEERHGAGESKCVIDAESQERSCVHWTVLSAGQKRGCHCCMATGHTSLITVAELELLWCLPQKMLRHSIVSFLNLLSTLVGHGFIEYP